MSTQVIDDEREQTQAFLQVLADRANAASVLDGRWGKALNELFDEGWRALQQTDPGMDVRTFLLALVGADVLTGLEPDGTLAILKDLEKMQAAGWLFIPPPAKEQP
jgi:hypothetical protein